MTPKPSDLIGAYVLEVDDPSHVLPPKQFHRRTMKNGVACYEVCYPPAKRHLRNELWMWHPIKEEWELFVRNPNFGKGRNKPLNWVAYIKKSDRFNITGPTRPNVRPYVPKVRSEGM
jgi:hypothetical protein